MTLGLVFVVWCVLALYALGYLLFHFRLREVERQLWEVQQTMIVMDEVWTREREERGREQWARDILNRGETP